MIASAKEMSDAQGIPFLYAETVLELQRKLIGDRRRNKAFYAALKNTIRRGKSVILDIGSGTGFLSFLGEKLGAKECWLVESGDVGTLGEELARKNGMKRCRFVHAYSSDIPLPKADVIVSETLGNYALEEGIISTMNDAREYLKKGGTLIPSSLQQFVCPVVTSRLQKEIDVWNVGYALDMSAARTISLQNMYVKTLKKSDLLLGGKASQAWDTVDFSIENDNVRAASVEWTMTKKVTIYGLALWWKASLAPGVQISTAPLSAPTHWEQIYLPTFSPVACSAGDLVRLVLSSDTSPDVRIRLCWALSLIRKGKTLSLQQFDTNAGLL